MVRMPAGFGTECETYQQLKEVYAYRHRLHPQILASPTTTGYRFRNSSTHCFSFTAHTPLCRSDAQIRCLGRAIAAIGRSIIRGKSNSDRLPANTTCLPACCAAPISVSISGTSIQSNNRRPFFGKSINQQESRPCRVRGFRSIDVIQLVGEF